MGTLCAKLWYPWVEHTNSHWSDTTSTSIVILSTGIRPFLKFERTKVLTFCKSVAVPRPPRQGRYGFGSLRSQCQQHDQTSNTLADWEAIPGVCLGFQHRDLGKLSFECLVRAAICGLRLSDLCPSATNVDCLVWSYCGLV